MSKTGIPTRRKKARRSLGDAFRFVIRQRAAPEQIALGLSLGTLIAFTPTVGVQIPLVLLVTTLFKANRVAGLLPIWLTNVFTIPAVYGFTYRIGHVFLPGRSPQSVRDLLERLRGRITEAGFYNLGAQFRAFARLGTDLFLPMLIGGLLIGIPAAILVYPVTRGTVRRYRRRRRARLQIRADARRPPPGQKETAPTPGPNLR